ncbi:MAG: 50S ribosomal protein L35ae [Candidatus Aenigmatarchaeota archaeon]|nr:MAG: 50S ribosomal protein L35ae [Candidatus Aenigmarchaeota archaeon]RLJ08640.1 MAG: 50S ribosomal protein L35ae [Candidatus Aenigmarchaeota archaeon]
MEARIVSYRRGRHTMKGNQLLIEIEGVDSKTAASKFIGKRVLWVSPGTKKKEIHGKITSTHGNNGALRVRFSKGLPGTVLGNKIEILD